MISDETVNQYRDYFQTDKDEFDLELLSTNKHKIGAAFENWTLPKQDKSGFQTFPLPKWDDNSGFWSNSLTLLQ
jgi:hypothetical protein